MQYKNDGVVTDSMHTDRYADRCLVNILTDGEVV